MSDSTPLRRLTTAAAAVVLAFVLAACGSGSEEPTPDGGEGEATTGTPVAVSGFEYGYDLEAPTEPGTYTFELTNDGAMQHDLVLEGGPGGATAIIGPGETDSFTATLEPGNYTLYCSVAGHRAQGMEVTFTIE